MKRVFLVIVLVPKTTFYLVVLLCTMLLMMGEFYVDDKYSFKKEQKISDPCYVICLFFYVVENGASVGLDKGARLQEASNFPN
jgi:hypothetical protein